MNTVITAMNDENNDNESAKILSRALVRALEMLRREQGVSKRNLDIFTNLEKRQATGRELAIRHNTTETNVYEIKFRTGHILRKYGPRYFERALRMEGYEDYPPFTPAA